jgi:exonuclease V gamma subunit
LPFFPRSALSYLEKLRHYAGEPDAAERALRAARGTFDAKGHARSDADEPYVKRLFSGTDPLGSPRFSELAQRVLGPMLEQIETEQVDA